MSKETKMEAPITKIAVEKELFNQVLVYLMEKPFKEVANMVMGLKGTSMEISMSNEVAEPKTPVKPKVIKPTAKG